MPKAAVHWAAASVCPPAVSFTNVSFELGSFLSKFVSPILQDIQVFTQPMQPINDVLTMQQLHFIVTGGSNLGVFQAFQLHGIIVE